MRKRIKKRTKLQKRRNNVQLAQPRDYAKALDFRVRDKRAAPLKSKPFRIDRTKCPAALIPLQFILIRSYSLSTVPYLLNHFPRFSLPRNILCQP
jgi:hypothetical protein